MTKLRKRKSGTVGAQMLDPAVLGKIALWLEDAGVNSVEIETEGGRSMRIVAGDGTAAPGSGPDAAVSRTSARPAKAPIAGHFLSVHPARDSAEATVGTPVFADQIVGFVRIGPLIMPIHAEAAGTLDGCVIEPGSLVGHGDTIFLVEHAQ